MNQGSSLVELERQLRHYHVDASARNVALALLEVSKTWDVKKCDSVANWLRQLADDLAATAVQDER